LKFSERGNQRAFAARITFCKFAGVKIGVGDVAAPAAGDFHLGKEVRRFFENRNFRIRPRFRAGERGEKARRPATHDHDAFRIHPCKIADAPAASHMKPVVGIGKDRPVNGNFRDEHEENDSSQREKFSGVAKFFQRAVEAENEQQQEWNQCAEHQPAGGEIRMRLRWIKTVVKIVDD